MSLLPAKLQDSMQEIVARSNQCGAHIRAILLSTTEGVPLGRVLPPPANAEHSAAHTTMMMNEETIASIESVWAPASKQLPVLGMGKVKQVTAIYDHGTLVHLYLGPLVRTYIRRQIDMLLLLYMNAENKESMNE